MVIQFNNKRKTAKQISKTFFNTSVSEGNETCKIEIVNSHTYNCSYPEFLANVKNITK